MNIADLKPGSYTPVATAAPAGGALNIKNLPPGSYTPVTAPAPLDNSPMGKFNRGEAQGSIIGDIGEAFNSSLGEFKKGFTPLPADVKGAARQKQALVGALHTGASVLGMLGSPLAPILKPTLGAFSNAAGNSLSDTPAWKAYGKDTASLPANEPTAPERALGVISDASTVAGGLAAPEAIVPGLKTVSKIGTALKKTAVTDVKDVIPNPAKTQEKHSATVSADLTKLESSNKQIRTAVEKAKAKGIDSKALLSQTNLLSGTVDETGTIRTQAPIRELNDFLSSGPESVIRKNLEKEGVMVPLSEIEKSQITAIDKSGLEGAALEAAYTKLDAEMKGLARRADNKGNVPLAKVHDAKVNKYSTLDYTNEGSKIADKVIAKTYKTIVEKKTRSADVQALNKELQRHYSVLDLLEKLDGKKVEGGRMGKHFARVGGALIGSHFGPLGAYTGSVIAGKAKGVAMSRTFGGKGGAPLKVSDAMKAAIKKGNAPQLLLPAPKPGSPKVSNHVPIPMRAPIKDEKGVAWPKR